ncbi:MAG: EVE domain-containing protein [Anaerolineales bacterium]|nr:EVE domain-containing protein [Anaerolineales bacterium]
MKGKNKKRSWFFRVSPNIYDIQEALKAGKPDCWPVRQYESEIHTGDRVYIWKSGNGAEILATAIVESEPLEVSGISERSPFMKKPEIFNRHGLVVNLQIENVLDRPITRKWLKKHPVLTWLQILRLSSCGSDYNFAVTPEQDRVLCREIRQRKIGSIPPPSSSGKSRDPKKVKIRTRNIKRFLKKTGFRELVKRRVLLKVSNEYRLKAGSVEPIIVLMRDQGIDRLEYPKRGWYLTTGYEFRNPESMENIRKVKMLKRKNNVFLNQNEYINPFYHGMLAAPHPTGERKQQKPVGAPIEERVKNLEKVVKHIYRQIDKMVQYQDSDPAASLAKARVVAETVCKQIYVNEGLEKGSRPAGRMMLEELLKALNQHHALPRQIHLSLLTIQYFGNFGAHDQGEESWEITDNSVKSCFHALVNVVSWYFKKYKGLKFEMPTSV